MVWIWRIGTVSAEFSRAGERRDGGVWGWRLWEKQGRWIGAGELGERYQRYEECDHDVGVARVR